MHIVNARRGGEVGRTKSAQVALELSQREARRGAYAAAGGVPRSLAKIRTADHAHCTHLHPNKI